MFSSCGSISRFYRPFGAMILLSTFVVAESLFAEEKGAAEDKSTRVRVATEFGVQVASIIEKHCSECHSDREPEHDLDLSSVGRALRGSKTGPVIVPSKPAGSLLIQVLTKGAEPHMPPDGQLSDEEIAKLSRWIEGLDSRLAVGPAKPTTADRAYWAFQPMVKSLPDDVANSNWVVNPIDAFVLSRLRRASLEPSGPADRGTLIRRVYYDLIGLPPTPEEVRSFISSKELDAYDQVVERLLASPRYGERWGRHWLDLARYADSGGFHNDISRPSAWRYRDYVIDAFNRDMSYSQFVREQIAGDELADASRESWIATGFARNGPSNEDNMGNGLLKEKYRLDELDGVISTTSNVFLGLTIGCARCHDHKFDPITQHDYYSFLAYYNSTEKQELLLKSFDPSAPELKPATAKPPTEPFGMVLTDRGKKYRETRLLWRGDVAKQGPLVTPGIPLVLTANSDPANSDPVDSDPVDFDAADSELSEIEVNEELVLGSNVTLRSDLANWMVGDGNPLTWRVMANRLWHYHFGRGLVATPSNFGKLGGRPSHPELLDWLAAELRDCGSVKSLHRLIVTSATYRQSSSAFDRGAEIDPENLLLWRMNRRRLEAEPLRDALLSMGDNINLQMGGVGVQPRIRPDLLVASQRNKWPSVKTESSEHWRRSVYVYVKRQLQLPLLELFDAPSTTHSCGRRGTSLVPTQALVLLNDEFVRGQARLFADRVETAVGADPQKQAELALWIALSRQPTAERIREGAEFIEQQTKSLEAGDESDPSLGALQDFCHVLLNLSEFVYID
ncbi:MAG: mono/diheme cytochrome c family protein [Pirellulaceae bacterium]|jgi:mono/diheme cytochrome c family protein